MVGLHTTVGCRCAIAVDGWVRVCDCRRCSCVHALRRHDAPPLLRDRDAQERLTRGAAHRRVAHCVGRRMRWVGQIAFMHAADRTR